MGLKWLDLGQAACSLNVVQGSKLKRRSRLPLRAGLSLKVGLPRHSNPSPEMQPAAGRPKALNAVIMRLVSLRACDGRGGFLPAAILAKPCGTIT